ncbi:MAG: DUF4339 domain-containing protein [Candidatus Hydrogenedens sp.]|nr:DUF4339 domain-containing protein [Candidatus Hydrogenedens sp.]
MWYYASGGTLSGPLTEDALTRAAEAGYVQADTPVWHQGLPAWLPYERSAAIVTAEHTTRCAVCGLQYASDDVLHFQGDAVCAACKPAFFQRLRETGIPFGTLSYATFGKRAWAKVVDWFIQMLATGAANTVLYGLLAAPGYQDPFAFSAVTGFSYLASIGVTAAYNIYFLGAYGATPGKMVMGIQVVRPDGAPLTYGRATGRFFAEMITGFTFFIGYLMAGFDKQHRALHDMIADTRVVDA